MSGTFALEQLSLLLHLGEPFSLFRFYLVFLFVSVSCAFHGRKVVFKTASETF